MSDDETAVLPFVDLAEGMVVAVREADRTPVLVAARCAACGRDLVPDAAGLPDLRDPRAPSAYHIGPGGRVYSYTTVHVSSSRPTPYTLGYVDLDEGVRVLATLESSGEIELDARCRLEISDAGDWWFVAEEQVSESAHVVGAGMIAFGRHPTSSYAGLGGTGRAGGAEERRHRRRRGRRGLVRQLLRRHAHRSTHRQGHRDRGSAGHQRRQRLLRWRHRALRGAAGDRRRASRHRAGDRRGQAHPVRRRHAAAGHRGLGSPAGHGDARHVRDARPALPARPRGHRRGPGRGDRQGPHATPPSTRTRNTASRSRSRRCWRRG